MESNIKIKATGKEMSEAFDTPNELFNIRSFAITGCDIKNTTDKEISNNKWVYIVRVRHPELSACLDRKQPYTITSLTKKIQELRKGMK